MAAGETLCVVATVFDDDTHLFPALRAGANADGPGFTELVNTGTPAAFQGREGVYLFTMTRFCGIGCGSIDHMTVIEEADGYRPIWGIPRIDASGDIVFDNIEAKP